MYWPCNNPAAVSYLSDMKKILAILILMICVQAGFVQSSFNYKKDYEAILKRTQNPKEPLYYNKLIKRFESNDTTLTHSEVLALMIGFTAKPQYKPYDDVTTERAIYDLNAQGKYDDALKKANVFLKTHPLSVGALFEKSYALYKKQDPDSAGYFAYRCTRIFQAMRFSGDGKSAETPCFALGPADGQDYIRQYIKGKLGTMGSGKDANGYFLDILEVKPKDGSTPYKLYFMIEHASRNLLQNLKPKEKPPKKK